MLFYFLHNFNSYILFFILSSISHLQPNVLSREMLYLFSSGVCPCRNYCVVFALFLFFVYLAAYYLYHSYNPFQNQIDHIRNSFDILFLRINFNFTNILEKLPRIDSDFLNQLGKLPWINSYWSLMSLLLTLKLYIYPLYQQKEAEQLFAVVLIQ